MSLIVVSEIMALTQVCGSWLTRRFWDRRVKHFKKLMLLIGVYSKHLFSSLYLSKLRCWGSLTWLIDSFRLCALCLKGRWDGNNPHLWMSSLHCGITAAMNIDCLMKIQSTLCPQLLISKALLQWELLQSHQIEKMLFVTNLGDILLISLPLPI